MAEVLLITALVLGLFYFLFIRPTRRELKKRERDLNALRIGDSVLTRAGFLATVASVETPENGPMILHLELAEGVVVEARTEAIAELLESADAGDESDEDEWEDDEGEWDEGDRDEDEEWEDAEASLEDEEPSRPASRA